MAAIVTLRPSGTTEDDEEWLYGDSGNNENKEPEAPGTGAQEALPKPPEEETGGDDQGQSQKDQDDDDDDSDDDDVQVTIGDIKAFPVSGAGTNLFKGSGTYQKQPVAPVGQKISSTNPGVKGVDVDGEGVINGVNVFEFSLDTLKDDEKPWRKPGADITDYFNYGFNEDSWRKYCQKQNRLRFDNGVPVPRAFANIGTGSSMNNVRVESADPGPPGTTSMQSNVRVLTKSQPTRQQTPGTIAVLGSTTASRRPMDEQVNEIQTIGTVSSSNQDVKPPAGVMPPGMPPMGIPPPDYSMPPPGMPPMPGFTPGMQRPPGMPPPGIPVPPPNMFNPPPTVPPFFPPHAVPPPQDNRNFGERPPFGFQNPPPPQHNVQEHHAKPSWDSRDSSWDRDRDRERRDYNRGPSPGKSGYNSDGSDDYRYSRSRDYSSSRDYYRSRDSDRSRSDRERSRSRERERRSHRDRDRDRDDKKSKRKIKDEPDDADYYKSSSSSKHKKSKRSKREKEEEGSSNADEGGS